MRLEFRPTSPTSLYDPVAFDIAPDADGVPAVVLTLGTPDEREYCVYLEPDFALLVAAHLTQNAAAVKEATRVCVG